MALSSLTGFEISNQLIFIRSLDIALNLASLKIKTEKKKDGYMFEKLASTLGHQMAFWKESCDKLRVNEPETQRLNSS